MIKQILFCCISVLTGAPMLAQVSVVPPFPKLNDDVTVYYNATEGNGALNNVPPPIYAHTGVITNNSTSPSDWKHVQTNWGVADANGLMTSLGNNQYSKSFNIKNFYGIQASETVSQLAFVFRNENGSIVGRAEDGSDIFYPVYPDNAGLLSRFIKPAAPFLLKQINDQIVIKAAVSEESLMTLTDNGTELVVDQDGTILDYNLTVTQPGTHVVEFTAISLTTFDFTTSQFTYVIPNPVVVEDPPAGSKLGANYLDDTSVRLTFYAPGKSNVFVVGDFNNWTPTTDFQMKRSVDGNTWWLDINGLTAGNQYGYQYLVNGTLKVADPLSEVVLTPGDDPYIPAVTYPDLPPYPTGLTSGNVSLLRPGHPVYNWQDGAYTRPVKTNLVIYELLMRDFIGRHDFQTMTDTLDYLQSLGVNAIELMPINEFEGNLSWGYNPSFHMAVDKYYGTTDNLKAFVDACHQRGIAVVADVVFNHAFGQSPLAQLYWDAANSRPAADNPWLNPIPKHPYNVGNDFNHESLATKAYVKRCLTFYLDEYHIDGFRFDLSKGFTQTNSGNDVNAWGNYDASRIAILKDYADAIWANTPGAYVILEHFANNSEEKELAEYGMMLWGNFNYNYNESTMGYVNHDFGWAFYTSRGWSVPHAVAYMESHDEERLMYKNLQYGNTSGTYYVKDSATAIRRQELASNFFYTIPGPKMLWQFGELGYDYCIKYCIGTNTCGDCKVDPKPIRWDYLQKPTRKRLHDVTEALIHLKTEYPVFQTNSFTFNVGNGVYQKSIHLNSTDMNLAVIGNFDVKSGSNNPAFQHTGWWYEYFSGDSIQVSNTTDPIQLLPGEYRLYTDVKLGTPPGGYIDYLLGSEDVADHEVSLNVYPNPATDHATIQFGLERSGNVLIEVYNLSGQRISRLMNERKSGGIYTIDIPVLPKGSYMVRLSVEGKTAVRKLIVE